MKTGIYCLYYEEESSKKYIGQSIDINRRYTTHCNNLRNVNHHNYKLQELFNKYNTYPKEIILEICVAEELNNKEVYWIDFHDTFYNGLNLTKGGIGNEIAIAGEHFNAKYEEDVYYNILVKLANTNLTNKEIGSIIGVHKRVVDSISCFSNHKYLLDKYPELCNKMLSHRGNKIRQIKSPNGVIYEVPKGTGNAFAKLHGLDGNSLNSVMRGALKSTAGWTKP